MKKIAIIVLILTFLFSLSACGDNNRQMLEECEHEYESETVVLENYGMTVNYNDLTMADNMLYGSKFEELTFEFNLTEVKN